MRTLVIQTSFLGDMVLTTPLLARLAESDAVDVVGTPAAIALLANHPAVHECIAYDKRGVNRGIAGFWKIGMQLRHRRYGRALLAQGSVRSGALAMAAGIGERIGFDRSAGRSLYTTRIPYVEGEHHALRLLRLSGDARSTVPRPQIFPGDAERKAVDVLVNEFNDEPLIGLAPGSVWPTKRWPAYAALARALGSRARLVVIGSLADAELAQSIIAVAPGRVIDATGRLSLLASAELIRRCRVLVTNDSAPQHLASAVNTPTVTIFGPTIPAFGFGPLAEPSMTLGLDSLPCRPCDRHGPVSCPLGHWKCMRELGVADVVRAIETLVS